MKPGDPPRVCPVCGFPGLELPARTAEGGGSFEICPSCGFQPGVDDDDLGITIAEAFARWAAAGKPWFSRTISPTPAWNPSASARQIAPGNNFRAGEPISICFPSHVNLDPFKNFIRQLASASGDVILPYFANPNLGLEVKSDDSPVTLADRNAELEMRRMIEKQFPTHGIIGEEFGSMNPDAEFVWVLDPVDGTKSFITAVPLFTTLIGLLYRGQPVLGCIHQPVLRQLMVGDGRETLLNESPVRVRSVPSLSQATLLTSDPLFPGKYQNRTGFEALSDAVRLYRTFGDGYGYLLVASGWADVMVDPIMKPWDLLPLIPCIEGAGGRITDWQGADAKRPEATSAVACAPGLHSQVVELLGR